MANTWIRYSADIGLLDAVDSSPVSRRNKLMQDDKDTPTSWYDLEAEKSNMHKEQLDVLAIPVIDR